MYTFSKISKIGTSLEELYHFHLDTNNIVKITPPDTKVSILFLEPPLQKGSKVILRAVKYFIPQTWEVVIEEAKEPEIVVDKAIRSPFKYWRHEHRFFSKNGEVFLEDFVEFLPPIPLFQSFIAFFIKKDLEKMFAYRHQKTREILE